MTPMASTRVPSSTNTSPSPPKLVGFQPSRLWPSNNDCQGDSVAGGVAAAGGDALAICAALGDASAVDVVAGSDLASPSVSSPCVSTATGWHSAGRSSHVAQEITVGLGRQGADRPRRQRWERATASPRAQGQDQHRGRKLPRRANAQHIDNPNKKRGLVGR